MLMWTYRLSKNLYDDDTMMRVHKIMAVLCVMIMMMMMMMMMHNITAVYHRSDEVKNAH